jgi:hypothetical protein
MFLPCFTMISGISLSILYLFFYSAKHETLFCLFLNFLESYGLQMNWGIWHVIFPQIQGLKIKKLTQRPTRSRVGHAMLGAHMHIVEPFTSVLMPTSLHWPKTIYEYIHVHMNMVIIWIYKYNKHIMKITSHKEKICHRWITEVTIYIYIIK